MRVGRIIAVYLITVFVAAALLAPWLYFGFNSLANHFPWAKTLAPGPFYRLLTRAIMGLALIGLWPLLRTLGVSSARDVGLRFNKHSFHQWSNGLGWGIAGLILLVALSVLLKERTLDLNLTHSLHELAAHFRKVGLIALIVSTLEEFVFRGCLFGMLRRGWRFSAAALVSSVIFAALHFLKHPLNPEAINWSAGFVILGKVFSVFTDKENLIPLINLALLGLVLCWAYEKTGALFMAMGIHAGVVICEKSFRFVTQPTPGTHELLWGDNLLVQGVAASIIIVVIFLGLRQQFAAKPVPAEIQK
jgi:membrane protease YdiL (CAAX protease family)